MAENWKNSLLAELLAVHFDGAWGEPPSNGRVSTPVVRSTEMRGGKLCFDTAELRCFPDKTVERKKLVQGDILVNKSSGSAHLVGLSVLFPLPPDKRSYLCSNFIHCLRPNLDLVDSEFLSLALLSPQFREQVFHAQNTTSGLRNLNLTEYLGAGISYPKELPEQRRVVSRIKECLSRVEEMQRLREDALEEATRFFGAYIEDKYTTLSQKFGTRPLNEMVQVVGGGTPDRKTTAYWSGAIPWVSPKDMKRWELNRAQESISTEALANSAAKLIKPPAVLFVVRGMILIHTLPVAISRVPLAINQDMKALIPTKELCAEFLGYMIRGASPLLLEQVEVAGHGTRRLQTEKWISLPIPNVGKAQKSLVAEFEKVRRHAEELVSEWREDPTITLRESVLREAFAGNL
jgi:type I restriction enzyme S subunit